MDTITELNLLALSIKHKFYNTATEDYTTLFSLHFASTKFHDFHDFEKIAKFNTHEI